MRNLHLENILQKTESLRQAFEAANKTIYLVGGIVRDIYAEVSNLDELDIDLTTNAVPEEIREILKPIADNIWVSGERFGTIGAHIDGQIVEITTHRSESYVTESRKPIVRFSDDIEEDLSRRDFTVNSMAIDLSSKKLIDPFNGRNDFSNGILRTPLDPEISFSEDPLRMLRAARFSCRYNLKPRQKIIRTIKKQGSRLSIVSPERIRDEFERLLAVENLDAGLRLLAKTGLLKRFFPEIQRKNEVKVPKFKQVSTLPNDSELRLAALLLNVKKQNRIFRMKELKYSNERISNTELYIQAVYKIEQKPIDPASYRRWYFQVGDKREKVIQLASINTRLLGHLDEMEKTRQSLEHELHDFSLPLSGADIMRLLGIKEGPEVGEALELLQEMRFQNGPISKEEAEKALLDWRN